MGSIAFHIQRYRRGIEKASGEIARCLAEIAQLQNSCSHTWRFNRQVNAHHERNWNITYKCTECDVERVDENRPPVCEICDVALVRTTKDDHEAEDERKKDQYKGHYNPPVAFRCPECKKIHILWHLGD